MRFRIDQVEARAKGQASAQSHEILNAFGDLPSEAHLNNESLPIRMQPV
jgi:hypothetical protein